MNVVIASLMARCRELPALRVCKSNTMLQSEPNETTLRVLNTKGFR